MPELQHWKQVAQIACSCRLLKQAASCLCLQPVSIAFIVTGMAVADVFSEVTWLLVRVYCDAIVHAIVHACSESTGIFRHMLTNSSMLVFWSC